MCKGKGHKFRVKIYQLMSKSEEPSSCLKKNGSEQAQLLGGG